MPQIYTDTFYTQTTNLPPERFILARKRIRFASDRIIRVNVALEQFLFVSRCVFSYHELTESFLCCSGCCLSAVLESEREKTEESCSDISR